MSNVKISALPTASTPLSGTELVPIVQSGVTSQTTVGGLLGGPNGSNLAGFLQSGTGAVATTVQAKLRETVSVKDFGAVGDGVTDDTKAFNDAIAYLKTLELGGTLFVPNPAVFYAVTSINCTNFSFNSVKFISIKGESNKTTQIAGTQNGVAVLDCTGSSCMTISDLFITTKTGVNAQCGLLTCRSTTETQANGNKFYNLWIQGNFTKASCISIGAESTAWYSPSFRNAYSSGSAPHLTFYTSDINGIGASSLYQTILASALSSPNTSNSMYSPHFYGEYEFDAVQLIQFESSGQWSFYSPELISLGSTNKTLAVYIPDSTSNVFNGSINWYEPLFECSSYTAHYIKGQASASSYAVGIRQYGGYMNAYTLSSYNLIKGDTSSGQTYTLQNCEIHNPKQNVITPGTERIGLVYADYILGGEYKGNIRYLVTSTGFTQNSIFEQFTSDSEFSATRLGTPIATAGSVIPSTGYYPKNSIRWNTNPSTGGYAGWVCTTAGNPGTWKGFGLINQDDVSSGTAQARSVGHVNVANSNSATVTISINSPGVISWTSHGLTDGATVYFSTTGSLPTGLAANKNYYVVLSTTNTFGVSATLGGAAINTSGSQSGVHTAYVGTFDMAVAPLGNGFQGFLVVSNSSNTTANIRTQTTYSVIGRGTSATYTSIATANGSLGGASFTLSTPSDGTIRVTNTSGVTTSIYIQFFGGISA